MAKKPTSNQKLYRNEGVSTLVLEGKELEPGSEFRATLDPDFELQMLSGGHLVILEDQSEKADRAQAEAAEEGETSVAVDEDTRRGRKRSNS